MGSLLLALIYVCFVSLGLPDSLLGSAWPVMHVEMGVSVSFAGVISTVICLGTIVSSLFSDKLLRRFGAGRVTAVSIVTTAAALFGFSFSKGVWALLLWSIPYGLGAGAIDAILNNYVALHYKAQHMSWLHAMWGIGAAVSPYVMGFSLISLDGWSYGYLIVAVIQTALSAVVFASLPLWRRGEARADDEKSESLSRSRSRSRSLSFKEIFATKGAVACFITFFAYCSLEITGSLWTSSYLVDRWDFTPESAAGFASLFYVGMTIGRLANGFLAMRLGDRFLIRTGLGVATVGIILLFVPSSSIFALIGFAVIGLGCAPIYPCIIHMTPSVFGEDKSQAMIGIQMAFAYVGFLVVPPLFGQLAELTNIAILPIALLTLLIVTAVMHEMIAPKKKK